MFKFREVIFDNFLREVKIVRESGSPSDLVKLARLLIACFLKEEMCALQRKCEKIEDYNVSTKKSTTLCSKSLL